MLFLCGLLMVGNLVCSVLIIFVVLLIDNVVWL